MRPFHSAAHRGSPIWHDVSFCFSFFFVAPILSIRVDIILDSFCDVQLGAFAPRICSKSPLEIQSAEQKKQKMHLNRWHTRLVNLSKCNMNIKMCYWHGHLPFDATFCIYYHSFFFFFSSFAYKVHIIVIICIPERKRVASSIKSQQEVNFSIELHTNMKCIYSARTKKKKNEKKRL